jgi:hypothetical protein
MYIHHPIFEMCNKAWNENVCNQTATPLPEAEALARELWPSCRLKGQPEESLQKGRKHCAQRLVKNMADYKHIAVEVFESDR